MPSPAMGSPSTAATISSPQFDAIALKKLLQNYDAACIIPYQAADGSLSSSFAPTPADGSGEENTDERAEHHLRCSAAALDTEAEQKHPGTHP